MPLNLAFRKTDTHLFTNLKTKSFKEGSTLAVGVQVRNNEDIDRALKRFRREVNRSRVLQEYRQNMAYIKPSEEKRLEKKKARRRRHREEKKERNRKRR
ncbi:MAG: 30S ribosomal protein S21 [Salinibacter sp.]|uniref:30S ribosomal protein S21 n=1 Tax=Salinibacter sp. TaxID=2065818 RepID=UPI0035D49489